MELTSVAALESVDWLTNQLRINRVRVPLMRHKLQLNRHFIILWITGCQKSGGGSLLRDRIILQLLFLENLKLISQQRGQ